MRPEPLSMATPVCRINANTKFRRVESVLKHGKKVCVTDTYTSALALYSWLKKRINQKIPERDYPRSRLFRQNLWGLLRHFVVPIKGGHVTLRKSPIIPWLRILYPEQREFMLPFQQVLGMSGSWQWYSKGLKYEFLSHPIHPYYGCYFSTRTEHLELFDAWLTRNSDAFNSAIDVGTGCGVLSFLLVKHGIPHVWATDSNPNAVLSVKDDVRRLGMQNRVTVRLGDLFASFSRPVDLVVFNPPWTPGPITSPLDTGSYCAHDLLPRFLQAAARRISDEGHVVVIYSNFARLAGIEEESALQKAIREQEAFELIGMEEAMTRPSPKSQRLSWLDQLREKEQVQLWILRLRQEDRAGFALESKDVVSS